MNLDLTTFQDDKKLKRWYDQFNKKFFDNCLPRDTRIGWSETLGDAMGQTLSVEDDLTHHLFFIIYISTEIKNLTTIVKSTILHEQCHIKLHPQRAHHGKNFNEEMLRLAHRGAFNGLW